MELIARNLGYAVAGAPLLDGVDARFVPGRVTVLLGPNGAGKSTLLRLVAGVLTPTLGAVTLGGRALGNLEPTELARLRGYLPQEGVLHWDLTVRELVALGRLPHRSRFAGEGAADRDAVAEALARSNLAAFAERRVHSLSGGERARALFARVLAGQPRWILADEPLANLDPAYRLQLLALCREVAAQGAGVVLVLHDLGHAAEIAHDVLMLKAGRVLEQGPAAEVLRAESLSTLFGTSIVALTGRDGTLGFAARPA